MLPKEPWLPPSYDKADAYAIKALAAGTANEAQQQRAFKWITNIAAGIDDLSFRPGPDGSYLTAFAEGRRFVGLQIYKLKEISSELLEQPEQKSKQPAVRRK